MATGHVRDGCIFPVGFIVHLTTDVDPAEYFGGKWQRIKGRFLLAADEETYPAGSTGGEATHTLTKEELPKTEGEFYASMVAGYENILTGVFSPISKNMSRRQSGMQNATINYGVKMAFGNNQPHNNMPPYRSVYIWERIG